MTQTNDKLNRNPFRALGDAETTFPFHNCSSKLGTSFPMRRRPFFFHYCQRLFPGRGKPTFASNFFYFSSAAKLGLLPHIFFALLCFYHNNDHFLHTPACPLGAPNRPQFFYFTSRTLSSLDGSDRKKQGERPGGFLMGWATGEKTTTGLVISTLAGDSPHSSPFLSQPPPARLSDRVCEAGMLRLGRAR